MARRGEQPPDRSPQQGLLVHGIVLCICAVAGFGIGRIVKGLRKR